MFCYQESENEEASWNDLFSGIDCAESIVLRRFKINRQQKVAPEMVIQAKQAHMIIAFSIRY